MNTLHGELYLDDNDEAHFICHTPSDVSFDDAEIATQKFIDLLQSQLDRKKECPMHKVHDAPTAPDSFSKEDLDRLTPREENRVSNAIGLAQKQEMHPSVSALLRFFAYNHLPEDLQKVSAPFCKLAKFIAYDLPGNAETTVALRKLLEAKDCAVRSVLT